MDARTLQLVDLAGRRDLFARPRRPLLLRPPVRWRRQWGHAPEEARPKTLAMAKWSYSTTTRKPLYVGTVSSPATRKPATGCGGCGCSHCTGAQATCLTGVLSGVVANPCGYTQGQTECGSPRTTGISGWNRTVTMNCPAAAVDIFPCTSGGLGGIGNYSLNTLFRTGCAWWTLDGPVVYDFGCEGDYYTFVTAQARYMVRNLGGGLVSAAVWIPVEFPFGTSHPFATLFAGSATTTTENACTFATPITFTNLITDACLVGCDDDYGYPIGLPAWVDGTFTVGAC